MLSFLYPFKNGSNLLTLFSSKSVILHDCIVTDNTSTVNVSHYCNSSDKSELVTIHGPGAAHSNGIWAI